VDLCADLCVDLRVSDICSTEIPLRRNLAPSWPCRRHLRSLQRLRPRAARSLRRRRSRVPRPAAGLRPYRGAGRRTGPHPRPRAHTRMHGLAVGSTVFACRVEWLLLAPPPAAQESCGEELRGSAHKKLLQFRFMCNLYKGKEPADLTDLIGRRQCRSDMYLNQPWLFYVSTVLKYGPARHQLEDEADKMGLARPTSVSASTVHTLLVRTAKALQSFDMGPWALNCGRVRQSGYLAWFLKWGVVQQLSGDSRGSAELCLGQGRKVYAVADKCSPELRTLCNSMLSLAVTVRTCQRRPSAPWC
jgi:hypothetical protein